jgi:hypothetical protein
MAEVATTAKNSNAKTPRMILVYHCVGNFSSSRMDIGDLRHWAGAKRRLNPHSNLRGHRSMLFLPAIS